jgi:hypothetical protein
LPPRDRPNEALIRDKSRAPAAEKPSGMALAITLEIF